MKSFGNIFSQIWQAWYIVPEKSLIKRYKKLIRVNLQFFQARDIKYKSWAEKNTMIYK